MKHKLRRQFTEEYREQQNSMKRIGLISDTHGTFDQTLKTENAYFCKKQNGKA